MCGLTGVNPQGRAAWKHSVKNIIHQINSKSKSKSSADCCLPVSGIPAAVYYQIMDTTVTNRCNGRVGRVFALHSVGREFDPRPSHTKDTKNGTCCFLCLALSTNEEDYGS